MSEAPRRTCVGCRKRRDKHELLRIAATPDGVRVDPGHHLPGRGAYVCPTHSCVERAAAREGHSLRRALRGAAPSQVDDTLHRLRSLVTDQGVTGTPDGEPDGRSGRPTTARSSNA